MKILSFLFGCGFSLKPALVTCAEILACYRRDFERQMDLSAAFAELLKLPSSSFWVFKENMCLLIFNFAAFSIFFQCVRFLWSSVHTDL